MSSPDMNKSMDTDVVISSRVRLARNIDGFPFPFRMSREDEKKVLDKVREAFFSGSGAMTKNFVFMDLQEHPLLDRQALVEKHLISPDMVGSDRHNGAIISRDEKISILINEEDHLRIQCLQTGTHIREAWELCSKLDALLEEKLDFAFDSQFGYLTCCPTNVGTGMRASAMLHLPALVMTGYIKNILEACGKLGVAVRGLYGENTEVQGNMFQISNQVTLGQSEEEIIASVNNVVSQIINQERLLRNELYKQNPHRFEDRVFRSFGIYANARVLSSEESMKLWSDIKLGVDMGILKEVGRETLDEIMLLSQPAILQKTAGKSLTPDERDIKRAEIIRDRLQRK